MSKPEWGTKRICPSCNARFYDMCRQPIACPKCANVFDPDAFVKKRRGRPPASEAKQLPLPAELEETIDLELAEELAPLDETDDVLEDTSDFGDGEDVVGIDATTDED
ncbi:MAG: TIGR02300 family protein [Proteobacteria bacterium]|nr:TIGR02300 family protein [Pseudomonadota bacterium]